MPLDILSDALALVSPVTQAAGGFDLGGDWAIAYPPHEGLKVFAVIAGSAWLCVEGEPEALRLGPNDCVILPNGRNFIIARDLATPPIGIEMIPAADWCERIATLGGGGDTLLLGGHFAFTGAQTKLLLGAMPPIMALQDVGGERLRWALEQMRQELAEPGPGSTLVVRHLAHLLLVQALRLYIDSGVGRTTGWLFALGDERIGRAAQAIHASPAETWTLEALAAVAGMSRSRFSAHFKAITGASPMEYLTHWRMLLACRRLTSGRQTVGALAASLGYASEAAFSTAFKREIGCSPRRYSKVAGESARRERAPQRR